MGGAATKTTHLPLFGPYVSFFHLFFFFWMLTDVYCIYIMVYYIHDRKGSDDENRPKQMCLVLFRP